MLPPPYQAEVNPLRPVVGDGAYSNTQNTCAYTTYFLLWWVPAMLAVPASIVLILVGIAWAAVSDHVKYITAFIVAVALIVYTVGIRMHSPRVLIRAGAFPALCRGDATPTTEDEFIDAVARIYRRTMKPPTIVGSGWGFFLMHRGARGPRIFTHKFKGRAPLNPTRWCAGTTIAHVAKELLKNDVTFGSHPTMDYISLGAWFARANHGNSGDRGTASSKCLKNARVLNMITGVVTVMQYNEIRTLFDGADAGEHVILDVEFHNLVQNVAVQKRGIIIDSPETAAEWLAPGAYLRLCFQGGARSYAIGARWEDVYSDTDHRDPHFCSRVCTYYQMDICSVFGGWHEPISTYTSKTTLYNANRWMPIILPFETIAVLVSGIRNFEIVFQIGRVLDGQTLFLLISEMIKIHKRVGGRSEVRYGRLATDTPIFLDCAMRMGIGPRMVFEMLINKIGVSEVALHPGKHAHLRTSPLARVSMAKVYGVSR